MERPQELTVVGTQRDMDMVGMDMGMVTDMVVCQVEQWYSVWERVSSGAPYSGDFSERHK